MELEQKLIELIDKAEAAGTKLAPEALDALVRAAQLEGTFALISGVVMLAICAGAVFLTCKFAALAKRFFDDRSNGCGEICVALAIISGAVSVFLSIFAAVNLLAASTWLKVIDPLAYVARQILMP